MPYNTFPPKFKQDILYPAILNLDEIDMSTSPIGEKNFGTYFDIEFAGYPPNTAPVLSYGKHAFTLSINPNPGGYDSDTTLPILRQKSRVLFEFKDAVDSNGNRRVMFSDITPIYNPNILKFMGYMWVKRDPLRTYESIESGTGILSVVGLAETSDQFWTNKFNIRSSLNIYLDLSTEVQNTDGSIQFYYNENISPIIFKNPNKMKSGSGLFVHETLELGNNNGDQVSYLVVTASNLQTYSGKVQRIQTEYWLSSSLNTEAGTSGSTGNDWSPLSPSLSHILQGNEFEEEIHKDYSAGINPKTEIWFHEISAENIPFGREGTTGVPTKVKFRFKFLNPMDEPALNILPLSGSEVEVGTSSEFVLHYPGGDPLSEDYIDSDREWLSWEGSGVVLAGNVIFGPRSNLMLETSAGEFPFSVGPLSTKLGLLYGSDGNPGPPGTFGGSDEPDDPN